MAIYIGHFEDSNGNVVFPTPHSYTSMNLNGNYN